MPDVDQVRTVPGFCRSGLHTRRMSASWRCTNPGRSLVLSRLAKRGDEAEGHAGAGSRSALIVLFPGQAGMNRGHRDVACAAENAVPRTRGYRTVADRANAGRQTPEFHEHVHETAVDEPNRRGQHAGSGVCHCSLHHAGIEPARWIAGQRYRGLYHRTRKDEPVRKFRLCDRRDGCSPHYAGMNRTLQANTQRPHCDRMKSGRYVAPPDEPTPS